MKLPAIKYKPRNLRLLVRKLILILVVISTVVVGLLVLPKNETEAVWYNGSWQYRKKITIEADQVSGSSDLSNFPVLVSISDNDVGSISQSDGDDILFTNSSGTKLDHEIEKFTTSTGQLVAWVEIPTLGGATDTVIYIYYGNPGAVNQENPTGVWDSNFLAVHHLAEDPSITTDDERLKSCYPRLL